MAITEARSLPPQFVEDLGKDYATQLTGLTSQALDTTKFQPMVAPQDQATKDAYTRATTQGQGIGSYAPYLTQAGQYQTGTGTYAGIPSSMMGAQDLTGPQAYQQFMSPYQQDVIDATLSEFDKQAAIRQQNIGALAAQTGNLGGGREGVLQSEYQTTSDRNRALLNAQLLGQGFGQAAGLRQQDFANQLGLAGAQAGLSQGQLGLGAYQQGLAGLTPQLGRGDIATLTDIGGIQQGQSQRVLDAQAQANQMQAMEPYQRLGVYGQGLSRIGQLPGSIQQQVTPDPTGLQTALGTASVVGGLMGLGSGYSNLNAQRDAGYI